jgi:hypothetical protein
MERVDGKSGGGTNGFIAWQRVGLADGGRADAIPHVAGGEGGHGAARPDGVIHRCVFYPLISQYIAPCTPSKKF